MEIEPLNVSIVVSTFGEEKWKLEAANRALPNAYSFGVPVYYNHGITLHETRNAGLEKVETEFVCFLDADDELAPDYFEHMSQVDGDLRPPSVNHVYDHQTFMPRVVGLKGAHQHVCRSECLTDGNWLVVGTVARTNLIKRVGGWKEWGNWEDWELWLRCWIAGATITPVPKAVYRAYSTSQGRNKAKTREENTKIYHQIRRANLPHLYG